MVRVCKIRREPEVSLLYILFLASRRDDTNAPYRRAGVVPRSQSFEDLLKVIYASSAISLYGFYCHAGDSYGSVGLSQDPNFFLPKFKPPTKLRSWRSI